MDILSLTISSALDQLQAGKLSAVELAQACLQAVERLNPTLNAFITVADLSEATASPPAHGALAGIPIAVKDLYQTAGMLTTGGTSFFKDFVPEQDAAAVEKLKSAGGTILGKTNTHEIALGVTGINPHYGAVHNPWDRQRISGGSSSGSAAAVAAGMCLAALGTDTGGSIRIPASLCGIVGLKPTYGRVSLRGIFPLSWNLDHAGPLTRTVRDAAILLQVLAGYDAHDPASVNLPVDDYLANLDEGVHGWRFAILTGDYAWGADPEVLEAVRESGEVFKRLGAQVEPVELNFLREAALANGIMTQADGAAFHHERMMEHPLGFGEDVRQRLQTGAAYTSSEYALNRRTQTEMRRRMELFFHDATSPDPGFDALLLPSTPIPAMLIEGSDALDQARRLTRFTAPFNLTGLPALSVPCGFTSAGLPVGLQIVAPHWAEKRLLQAGQAFEQATSWHKMKPSL
jgi:aspartyl-tRNA(Asn)/glutamyl-tRNA(Gln) amidotransferase subunit A